MTELINKYAAVLDLSSYSSGIYFITVSPSWGTLTQKTIKNNVIVWFFVSAKSTKLWFWIYVC
jgi:hypothetical protein